MAILCGAAAHLAALAESEVLSSRIHPNTFGDHCHHAKPTRQEVRS
jgi:hypothetical protein